MPTAVAVAFVSGEPPRLLESGYDLPRVQERLGHGGVSTTMISPQVLNRGPSAIRTPADTLRDTPVGRNTMGDPPVPLPRYTAPPRSLTRRSDPERR